MIKVIVDYEKISTQNKSNNNQVNGVYVQPAVMLNTQPYISTTFQMADKNNKITFDVGKIELFDIILEWCFDNTTHRFTILGTDTFYFEDDNDATTFKIRWG